MARLLPILDSAIESGGDWPSAATLTAWRENDQWTSFRKLISASDERAALGRAYMALRQPIGPAPLRDIAFIAGMLFPELTDPVEHVIALAQELPGASLSGGRMSRAPESIYMTDETLSFLGLR